MIETVKKLFKKRKEEKGIESIKITDLGSAVKENSSLKKSDGVGYFGSIDEIKKVNSNPVIVEDVRIPPFPDEPKFPPPGDYEEFPGVMFETNFWIKRSYLIPIGRSRITGYTIYRYTGNDPKRDLDSIGFEWGEVY